MGKMNEYDKKIDNLLTTDEINRLQRAAKNKDKKEIIKWATAFENLANKKYYEIYKNEYSNWVKETFKDMDVAVCSALHFNEKTRFGNKRIADVMQDISENIRGYYRGVYTREEYIQQLIDDGIMFFKKEDEDESEEDK